EPGARRQSFGSIGLMIAQPETHLTIEAGSDWSAAGPHSKRVQEYARTLAELLGLGPLAIEVHSAAAKHVGLGVGTQLAMAVATGFLAALPRELPRPSLAELAARLERGNRSAIGIHGAIHGGFLLDGGRSDIPAPLLARLSWPEHWAILVAMPAAGA